jgi:para-nitrobenzyl esterase
MILGNVMEETRAFLDPRPKIARPVLGQYRKSCGGRGQDRSAADHVIAQYRMHHPDWSPEQVYYAATTAGRSWPGQVIEADARAAADADKTWVYCLTRRSPVDPLRGAAHTDDIPYVFGTLDAPGSFSGSDAGARATRDASGGLCENGQDGQGSPIACRNARR